MTNNEADTTLARLFAVSSWRRFRRAFRRIDPNIHPDLEARLVARSAATEQPEHQKVYAAQLALFMAALSGDFRRGWAAYARVLGLSRQAFIEDAVALVDQVETARLAGDWGKVIASGRELLGMASVLESFDLEMEALTAIALGNAMQHELAGTGMEEAIACWEQAISVVDKQGDARLRGGRASLASNLAAAYGSRSLGDPRQNLERSIRYGQEALAGLGNTPGDEWALVHTNLGLSLVNRSREVFASMPEYQRPGRDASGANLNELPADLDIEEAISHFFRALEWRTPSRSPGDWAFTQMNLGLAYDFRLIGSPAENASLAEAHYREAAAGFAMAGMPQRQGQALVNVGNVLLQSAFSSSEGPAGLTGERLAAAERVATEALDLLSSGTDVHGRAALLRGRVRFLQDDADAALSDFHKAIVSFRATLNARELATAATFLAETLVSAGDWPAAVDAWHLVMEAEDEASGRRLNSDSRLAEYGRRVNVHRSAAFAAVRAGNPEAAIGFLERGRARELTHRLVLDSPQFERLLSERPELAEAYLKENSRDSASRSRWCDARSASDDVTGGRGAISAIRDLTGFRDFLRPPSLQAVQQSLAQDEAIAYIFTSAHGSAVLLIVPEGDVLALEVPELTAADAVRLWVAAPDSEDREGYLFSHLGGSSALEADIDRAGELLGPALLRPLRDCLAMRSARRLTVVPAGLLGQLPIGALTWWDDGQRRCLLDEYVVSVAPSAAARLACQRRLVARDRGSRRLVAVSNPTWVSDPLPGAEREIAAVVNTFAADEVVLFEHDQAIRKAVTAALPWATHLHLAAHGEASILGEPYEASIVLADGPWTAREMLSGPPLEARLVVASACETAVPQGAASVVEEAISLSSVFIAAGAAGVVGSLWSVDDDATALLMSRFYEELRTQTVEDPAGALRQAQLWLRGLSVEQVEGEVRARLGSPPRRAADGKVQGARGAFASPVYWAAFVHSGS